jgi:hypothetical protein
MDNVRAYFVANSAVYHKPKNMTHLCTCTIQLAIEQPLKKRLTRKSWMRGRIAEMTKLGWKLADDPQTEPGSSDVEVMSRRIVSTFMRELLKEPEMAELEAQRQINPGWCAVERRKHYPGLTTTLTYAA